MNNDHDQSHNCNDNDNSLHRAKSCGSEPCDENAESKTRDGSVAMAVIDLASSTGPAHPGQMRSRSSLESPEHQGVWEPNPQTHLLEFGLYIHKY